MAWMQWCRYAAAQDNPHLEFVLADTVEVIGQLRAEGKTVLLHCVQAQSRTPTVAAMHSVVLGIPAQQALAAVCAVLPDAQPNAAFVAVVDEWASGVGTEPPS